MNICRYCQSERKNSNSLKNHERLCPSNPDRIKPKGGNRKGMKGSNQYIKARKLGLSDPTISEETRQKISLAAKKQNSTQWNEETRLRHSEIMKQAVIDNPDSYSKKNVSGRVKQVEYNNQKFKGQWEADFARWCDDSNISYSYEPEAIPYQFNGSEHQYFPDFQLENGMYVEVKGYIQERDIAKWITVKDNICIITEEEIDRIRKGVFDSKDLRPIGERVHALLS